MKEQLEALRSEALAELQTLNDPKQLEDFRVRYMGKKGSVTALLRGMKVDEAISRLEGITCKVRPTSCPDQVAQALKLIRDGAL